MEKRRYPRIEAKQGIELEFSFANLDSPYRVKAFTRDISIGGVCAEVKDFPLEHISELTPHPRIISVLELPPAVSISALGEIRWHQVKDLMPEQNLCSTIVGIRLSEISESDKKVLTEFINSRMGIKERKKPFEKLWRYIKGRSFEVFFA